MGSRRDRDDAYGFANGAFEELEEDGTSVVEEFYPEVGADEDTAAMGSIKDLQQNPLHDRLNSRLKGRDQSARADPPRN